MKFGERLKNFFLGKTSLGEESFDDLCDLLIEGDFGPAQAYKMTEQLKERCKKDSHDVMRKLCVLLEEELDKAKPAASFLNENKMAAILILGVNGVGKTTTAAKLSHLFNVKYNKKTILAAADTFRAAAIDQLKIHGEKLNVRVVAHKQGGDPAAVVYDALEAALSGGADVIIADTAGRMHTKSSLVEELKKIDRVVESKSADIRCLKYLVLDATTGRNAFSQAEIFNSAVNIDGVILTKYDSTAKGGVVFSLASELNLPVAYVCTGEKYTDIETFDNEKFAKEFAGIE
ncbi:MAG: signal recognition particle-docking protein FtsY [Treponema sp.]|nr:signal recognition particle-docking protein FtsY [Treponema sp.]MCL2236695.1 signal recognition particle-docking protein FtsY [Treponema sp.]